MNSAVVRSDAAEGFLPYRKGTVVHPAGDLLAFQRMDSVCPASADLAIEKARTAARLQRSTAEIEDNINQGRTAFVTAGILVPRGMPDPCKRRSRGRNRCCWPEQGDRRRDREHRGVGAEPLTDDSSA
jgi:hypothetical protein